ncbi:MAG: hypothetical protein QXT38_01860 [Candidatus Aenigmatarchaeota archaeon]
MDFIILFAFQMFIPFFFLVLARSFESEELKLLNMFTATGLLILVMWNYIYVLYPENIILITDITYNDLLKQETSKSYITFENTNLFIKTQSTIILFITVNIFLNIIIIAIKKTGLTIYLTKKNVERLTEKYEKKY